MTYLDWIGSIGVAILLIAFFLNLADKLSKDNIIYLFMNLIGAGLACIASMLLKYAPFIILETAWTCVSLFYVIDHYKKKAGKIS